MGFDTTPFGVLQSSTRLPPSHRGRFHVYNIYRIEQNWAHPCVHFQDMQRMYSAANGKGAKFLEAPVSGSKVRPPH